MHSNVSYSGITTKIKAMEGSLVTPKMYEEISYLTSVPEFITYLREKTSYADVLKNVDIMTLHRNDIERLLSAGVYDDFKKLYRFAGATQRGYLNLYFKKFETDVLIKCIRRVITQSNDVFTSVFADDFFTSHSCLNVPALAAASTMSELIELTRNSEYYEALNTIHSDTAGLFDYELSLELYCYRTIWRTLTRKCSGTDADMLINCYGTKIDLLNLSWIQRGKFNLKLDEGQLFSLIIPYYYKLKAKELEGLIHSGSVDEFNQILSETYYGRHYDNINADNLYGMYDFLVPWVTDRCYRENPYSIASAYSYLIKKEQEQSRLTRALECIRYGLNQRKILEYMNGGTFR